MSLMPKRIIEGKHCFVYCGPDRCDCRVGNPHGEFVKAREPICTCGELWRQTHKSVHLPACPFHTDWPCQQEKKP